jgi:hypothetical protein
VLSENLGMESSQAGQKKYSREEAVWVSRRSAVSGCGSCILDRLMLSPSVG